MIWVRTPSSLILLLGWSIVHFGWQATLLYGIYRIARWRAEESSPAVRHLMGCVALLMMFALPLVTAGMLQTVAPTQISHEFQPAFTSKFAVSPQIRSDFIVDARDRIRLPHQGDPTLWDKVVTDVAPWMPVLAYLWMIGLLIQLFGHLREAITVSRIKRYAERLTCEVGFQGLAARMGLNRKVLFLRTTSLLGLATVGTLRPVVLLPIALANDLSPAELDVLILHELAHIRRFDHLTHLLCVLAETIFFFHPCVWLLCRSIRQDAEECCDADAVRAGGDRSLYATALFHVANIFNGSLIVGASGGSVAQRLLALTRPNRPARISLTASGILILLGMVLSLGALTGMTEAAEKIRQRETLALIPAHVFVYDLLNAVGANLELRSSLISALHACHSKAPLKDPSYSELINALKAGGDPGLVWKEYQRIATAKYHPILKAEFPADWPFSSAGMQRQLARVLYRIALSDPADSAASVRAALLIAAMHREQSGLPAIADIVMDKHFEAASGLPPETVELLREYASLASDAQTRSQLSESVAVTPSQGLPGLK